MITVKKDAIKYKTPDGMQSAGVLCNISALGEDWFKYAYSIGYFFYNVDFEEGTEITLNIPVIKKIESTFQGAYGLKKIKLIGNLDNSILQGGGIFWQRSSTLTTLEEIDLSEFGAIFASASSIFRDCKVLKKIYGTLDFSNCTSFTVPFNGCSNLEYVRFKEESIKYTFNMSSCSSLSDASIQSIIDGLANVEEARTLTFSKTVKDKLTEEQIVTITSKNWTLA